jgi:cell division protein FtsN
MAKQRNQRANNRSSYKRPPASSKPSPRAWIIAVLLVVVFAGGVGFLDSHRKDTPTAFIHQILQHKHTTTETGKAPSFDFYTALPSGKLAMMPSSQTTSTTNATASETTKINPTTQASVAPVATTKTTAPTATITNYFLQVASFPQYADADRLKAQLLLDNFNANTEKSMINGKEWYRVVVGPYHDLASLNAAQAQLNTLHFQSIKLQLK